VRRPSRHCLPCVLQALEFARSVPRPKLGGTGSRADSRNSTEGKKEAKPDAKVTSMVSPQVLLLMQRHDKQRQAVDKMRSELGL
jgi:hypothetical protein